jgi:hypothetical protein
MGEFLPSFANKKLLYLMIMIRIKILMRVLGCWMSDLLSQGYAISLLTLAGEGRIHRSVIMFCNNKVQYSLA